MRTTRFYGLIVMLASAVGCASAPPKPPAAPVIPVDQKLSWVLRLEDRRILRDPAPPPAPAPPPVATKRNKKTPPPPPPPPAPEFHIEVSAFCDGASPKITATLTATGVAENDGYTVNFHYGGTSKPGSSSRRSAPSMMSVRPSV